LFLCETNRVTVPRIAEWLRRKENETQFDLFRRAKQRVP